MRFGKADVHNRWMMNKLIVNEPRSCAEEYEHLAKCLRNVVGHAKKCLGYYLRMQLCFQQNQRDVNKMNLTIKNMQYQLARFSKKLSTRKG